MCGLPRLCRPVLLRVWSTVASRQEANASTGTVYNSVDANVLRKEHLGYTSKYSAGLVDVNFDFVSLTVAAAFNLGIPNKNLVYVDLLTSWFVTHNGVTYQAAVFADMANPGMSPTICLERQSGAETVPSAHPVKDKGKLCFYQVGSYSSGIPMPEDVTSVPDLIDYCTKSQISTAACKAAFEQTHADHPWLPPNYSLLEKVGLWPNFPNTPDATHPMTPDINAKFAAAIKEQQALWDAWAMDYQFGKVLDLVTKYSYRDLNDVSYGTGFYSFAPSLAAEFNHPCDNADTAFANPIYDGLRTSYDAFAFCDNECTIMSAMTGGGLEGTNALNSEMLQMPWLACNDTFNLNATSFEHLLTTPPTALVEQYYKCTPFLSDALTNAIGIAAGMVGTLAPIAAILFSTALFLWLYTKGAVPHEGLEDIKAREFALKVKSEVSTEVKSEVSLVKAEVQTLAKKERSRGLDDEGPLTQGVLVGSTDGARWEPPLRASLAAVGNTTLTLLSLGLYSPGGGGAGAGRAKR